MALSELLLAGAALVAAVVGILGTIILWLQRPRYRRSRRSQVITPSPSASSDRTLGPPDEVSLSSPVSPRTRGVYVSDSVADVVDGRRLGDAEAPLLLR